MAKKTRNKEFRDHRLKLASPTRPGRKMSRAELATVVNRKLARLYPRRRSLWVTARWIKDVELGESSWPWEERRRALRIVLGASSDAAIGLYDSHPRSSGTPIESDPVADQPGEHQTADSPTLAHSVRHPARGSNPECLVGRDIDWSRPQAGRVYDYLLGGKDHLPPDRVMGDDMIAAFPTAKAAAAASHAFLQRTVRFLAAAGIRQFLDIGAGIPRPGCTHEIAQAIKPDSRVVYVDSDPVVMQHVRARHVSDPAGCVDHVQADLRHPAAILDSAAVRDTLDLHQPVGVLLGAVVHHIPDDEDAAIAIKQLLAPMPPGSFLVISHVTTDFSSSESVAAYEGMYAAGRIPARARTAPAILNYLQSLELVEPGLVPVTEWRPSTSTKVPPPKEIGMYGVVGRIR